MMTNIEFIHLLRARVTRDGTICAKNSTFGYFDGINPITGKGTSCCLLPRLWLLNTIK